MFKVWEIIKNGINVVFHVLAPKDYLIKRVENLKNAHEKRKPLPFVLLSSKESGFSVKIGGMDAYLPYIYMPWHYRTPREWQNVSKYLIGKSFFGEVYHISAHEKPIRIKISAKFQNFKPKALTVFEQYKTVIVGKSQYGLFLDLGYHYKWKYGSFLGLLHHSSFLKAEDFENARPGQVMKAHFHGYSNEGKLLLGNQDYQSEWRTGALERIIGTSQMITVTINRDGKKEFFVMDMYKTTLPLTKAYYHKEYLKNLKDFRDKLNDGDRFEAKIVKISRYDHFVAILEVDGEKENHTVPLNN